jgi:hypothetical protein
MNATRTFDFQSTAEAMTHIHELRQWLSEHDAQRSTQQWRDREASLERWQSYLDRLDRRPQKEEQQ